MKSLSYCVRSVKKPADIYKDKSTDDHKYMIPVLFSSDVEFLFPFFLMLCHKSAESNDNTIVHTIYNILPGSTMPYTNNEEYDQIRQTDW